jgi:hypothetical protein
VALDERGLVEGSPVMRNMDTWRTVTDIVARPKATYLSNNQLGVYILPRHAFASDDEYLDFVEKAIELRRRALSSAA